MISAMPTKNLTGITLEGDFEDFYEIVESIYRMTDPDIVYEDNYWSIQNRLLGLCYDIRHAYIGDRDVKLVGNGVNDEMAFYDPSETGGSLQFECSISRGSFCSIVCP